MKPTISFILLFFYSSIASMQLESSMPTDIFKKISRMKTDFEKANDEYHKYCEKPQSDEYANAFYNLQELKNQFLPKLYQMVKKYQLSQEHKEFVVNILHTSDPCDKKSSLLHEWCLSKVMCDQPVPFYQLNMFAREYDAVCTIDNQCQRYGTARRPNGIHHRIVNCHNPPTEYDIEKINQRRATVGYPPLKL